jgi:streptogramin lyase
MLAHMKYVGITSAANGKLYCAPRDPTQVLEIDPVTGTTALIGSVYAGTAKYYGITSAANGKLYCAPFNATQVLEIDPVTGTTTLIGSVYADT